MFGIWNLSQNQFLLTNLFLVSMAMKKLILCDFDGTISLEDMGYVLVNRFSSGNWEEIDRDFCQGNIGSKEAYSRIANILKGDEKDFLGHRRVLKNFVITQRERASHFSTDLKSISL